MFNFARTSQPAPLPQPPTSRLQVPSGYKERVKTQFESRCTQYDLKGDYHQSLAQKLIDFAHLRPCETILDAACGTGIVTLLAAEKLGENGQVIGVDMSPGMLSVAQSKLSKLPKSQQSSIHFVCHDLEAIAYPASYFDAILCSAALVFMSDIPKILASWHSSLKSATSRLVFNTPKSHASAAFEIFAKLGENLGAGVIEDPSTLFSTEDDVQRILSAAGFSSVEIHLTKEGRQYPGLSPQEYARTMWSVCSNSPFSPVEKLVDPETGEQWKKDFFKLAAEVAEKKLMNEHGVIQDYHEMFWVLGKK